MARFWCTLVFAAAGCVLPELATEEPPVDEPACRACAEIECSEPYEACLGDPACDQILSCALACPPESQDCIAGCGTASPEGIDAALELLDCAGEGCAEDCGDLVP